MRRRSLAFRLVASAALWCALLLSVGGLGLSALFGSIVERNFDQQLNVLLEGLVAGSEIDEQGAFVLRPQLGEPRFAQPLSGWYWEVLPADSAERFEPVRSPSLFDETLEVRPLEGRGEWQADVRGPDGSELRLLARTILLPGADTPFTYVLAGDRTEITTDQRRFDRLLMLSLGVLFAGLLIAIFLQVRFGLEPLRRLGRALAAIRAGRTRRLEGDFPPEVGPLAAELNALLDYNEALVERARTHVGNLAHGLKTPLTVLTNEATRHEGPLAELMRRQVRIMRDQVDHHLGRARAAATTSPLGARTELAPVAGDLVRTLGKIHLARGLRIESRLADGLAFRGARQDLEEMLGNLLDNACKWARSEVVLCGRREGERLHLEVLDDGPGLPPGQRHAVMERGRRLDERVPGSGLGLAIVADLAELYGGRIELGESPTSGLAARLELPAAAALAGRPDP